MSEEQLPAADSARAGAVRAGPARADAASVDLAWAKIAGAGTAGAGTAGVHTPVPDPLPVPGAGSLRAVITDWGGVLTRPIRDVIRAWIEADQIDWDNYVAVLTPWLSGAYQLDGDANPVHRLERGECTAAEFEELLAARLVRTDGGVVSPEGLLKRMLSASETPVTAMYGLIRTLRGKGLRTALLSNSWGSEGYPRQDFAELFDVVVISGEVGMRKPEPRIFRHAAKLLGVPPQTCVFIDDVQANVDAAVACGMTGVRHTDPALTVATLTSMFADGYPGTPGPAAG